MKLGKVKGQCGLCMSFYFCYPMKIVVAVVTEIVKMFQKHTYPKIIQASLMKLGM